MPVSPEIIADINQTINTALSSHFIVSDFSRFSSLLEVAFALNISYKIIPDIMERLGQKKAKKIEENTINDWKAEIADRESLSKSLKNSEKTSKQGEISSFKNAIDLLSDESGRTTKRKEWSITLSKIAPFFALVAIILLFLGSLGICPLTPLTNSKEILQPLIVFILLLPNIIAVGLQVWHWKFIEQSLNEKTKELEEKILPKI